MMSSGKNPGPQICTGFAAPEMLVQSQENFLGDFFSIL
jgi:hypothetical protein